MSEPMRDPAKAVKGAAARQRGLAVLERRLAEEKAEAEKEKVPKVRVRVRGSLPTPLSRPPPPPAAPPNLIQQGSSTLSTHAQLHTRLTRTREPPRKANFPSQHTGLKCHGLSGSIPTAAGFN
eukprot:7265248-Prymnesium_polylepis.1